MINRILTLRNTTDSFFLWGPRLTGKTSLLRGQFPGAEFLDLLKSDHFVTYQRHPERLREELLFRIEKKAAPRTCIIDEIQKIPALLDEVHWLIENTGIQFGLCGSSARKVKRGSANLLGGRALRFELHGFSALELGPSFDLIRMVNHGYLPRHYLSEDPRSRLRSYCTDYLKEEIAAEGLVRNLPSFAEFLEAASLSDCELVNYSTIARDVGVSQPTVRSYFEILTDTMLASFLPAYRRRPKRRVIQSPKFYFFDLGVVNHLARRGRLEPGSELFGKAFENWVFHELSCYRDYQRPDLKLSYWRLASGTEVDFILGEMDVALEAKASSRINDDHFKGLRAVSEDHKRVRRRIVVCLEKSPRRTADGIEIWPVQTFLQALSENSL